MNFCACVLKFIGADRKSELVKAREFCKDATVPPPLAITERFVVCVIVIVIVIV